MEENIQTREIARPGTVPLDGLLERSRFEPFMTAVFALLIAFVLFQFVISPIAIALMLVLSGVPLEDFLTIFQGGIEEYARVFLTANTLGQVLGLAVPAYLFARLHSSRPNGFLRAVAVDGRYVFLALLGVFALMPLVQWLGHWNDLLPFPESLRAFERQQIELIDRLLAQDTGVVFNLIALALTPAICEELLFRGYVQRQAERSLGALGGILFSGIAFGFYHIRLTQVVPLSLLGIYLAYLVWRTRSLIPAMVVHFANNAFAVLVGAYTASNPDSNVTDLENMTPSWYFVLGGGVVFAIIVMGIQRVSGLRTDDRPVDADQTSTHSSRVRNGRT